MIKNRFVFLVLVYLVVLWQIGFFSRWQIWGATPMIHVVITGWFFARHRGSDAVWFLFAFFLFSALILGLSPWISQAAFHLLVLYLGFFLKARFGRNAPVAVAAFFVVYAIFSQILWQGGLSRPLLAAPLADFLLLILVSPLIFLGQKFAQEKEARQLVLRL